MRIEKIKACNYRQYKDLEIDLNQNANDIFVLLGKNGTGKTNLLNAVNWCLYKDEPHLSRNSQTLPTINIQNINEANTEKQVKVEIYLVAENNKRYIMSREALYRIYDGNNVSEISNSFKMMKQQDNNNWDVLEKEQSEAIKEHIFPFKIREFFFFDGERLDSYFKDVTSQKIRNAIFKISNLDLLEKVIKNLDILIKEYQREAGRQNPNIEATNEELQKKQELLEINENRYIVICDQLSTIETTLEDLLSKIKQVPEVSQLEQQIKKHLDGIETDKKLLKSNIEDKNLSIIKLSRIILVWQAIKKTISVIDSKRSTNEMPPLIDKTAIDEILKTSMCLICKRSLDIESKKVIEKLKEQISLSSSIVESLISMESILRDRMLNVGEAKQYIDRLNVEIEHIEQRMSQASINIEQIRNQIRGYDVEQIKQWYEQYEVMNKQKDSEIANKVIIENEIKTLKVQVKDLKEKLDSELRREGLARDILRKIQFCEKARNVLEQSKNNIMKIIKNEIQEETQRLFMGMIWKKNTFKSVMIGDDYSVGLIHNIGSECLGSLSAAERELLALSFTLALHKVSRFDCPIIIDTPVSRVSDDHRRNMANVFLEISQTKQVILLFTPSEYSNDISSVLDKSCGHRYVIAMSTNEKESTVEVLK